MNKINNYQLDAVMSVLGCDEARAEALLEYMDETGDHPDWSESSDNELRTHFLEVETEMAEVN